MESVFAIKQWEAVQKSLAKTTGMAIIMVDYKGKPLSQHSCCCDFCQKIRQDDILGQYCEKCDSRGGAEAVRQNRPYIYECCFGLIDVAIPIVFHDTYLGAVMIGQVKSEDSQIEKICTLPENKAIAERLQKYQAEYQAVPKMDYAQIHMVSYMLYDICNYIIVQENEKQYPNEDSPIEKAMIHQENKIIAKAKEYIAKELERVTLQDTAQYCNVSTSYLSRLFVKETGERFSIYVAHRKMEQAKEWLETTDMSISNIGYTLGFNETGYFIKAFKKDTGMTPGMYRKCRANMCKK